MSDANLAWCAGFFDGEGCVSVSFSAGYYAMHCTVAQKFSPVLEEFRRRIGDDLGKIYAATAGHHLWSTSGRSAGITLTRIEPWLYYKKPQAALGIEFASLISDTGSQRTNPEVIRRREEIREELRRLKKSSTSPNELTVY